MLCCAMLCCAVQVQAEALQSELEATRAGHRAELSRLEANESSLLERVFQLGKQLAAAQEKLSAHDTEVSLPFSLEVLPFLTELLLFWTELGGTSHLQERGGGRGSGWPRESCSREGWHKGLYRKNPCQLVCSLACSGVCWQYGAC